MVRKKDSETISAADVTHAVRPKIAVWKKVLLALSVALMVAGGGIQLYAWLTGEDVAEVEGAVPGALAPSGFAPTGDAEPGSGGGAGRSGAAEWSPTVFRLGFSFFVGFAIAYALRTFIKVSIVAIGLLLLLFFALQYAGLIEVRWDAIGAHYDSITAWLAGQTGSMKAFIQGYLPSAGSGAAGMALGFKKS
jgi:uncharacterized membrane protein (Fun14 family)